MAGSKINHPRSWNGKRLTGTWSVTLKLDGVRAIWHAERGWLSRANKSLYNLPPWIEGQSVDCEVFVNNFQDTIRATRTKCLKHDTPSITREHLFGLAPIDDRLHWGTLTNPDPAAVITLLKDANNRNYEGLVLRQDANWIKVKPVETHDVLITGVTEGNGKHRDRLGFVSTIMGAVGSGFSDAERRLLWADAEAGTLVGQTIEVSCMQVTPAGQFRHPVFIRMRPDKLAST